MKRKNQAAVELGRRGGKARAKSMTAAERKASAKKAIEARWAKARALGAEIEQGTKRLLESASKKAR